MITLNLQAVPAKPAAKRPADAILIVGNYSDYLANEIHRLQDDFDNTARFKPLQLVLTPATATSGQSVTFKPQDGLTLF